MDEFLLLNRIYEECLKNEGNITTVNYDKNPNERELIRSLINKGLIERPYPNHRPKDSDIVRITAETKSFFEGRQTNE